MKNIYKYLLIFPFIAACISCEEGEVFTGSPVDNPNISISTVTAVISTIPEAAAATDLFLTDQKIPITITLPRSFADTVQVEATALAGNGRRRRAYVEILPNQTQGVGEILAAGGDLFDNTFTLAATAIELYTVEPGKHYLLDSNILDLRTGNTTIPDNDLSRLQIKLAWPDASSSTNNLRLVIDRPDPIADANPPITGSIRLHYISNVNATTPNSNNSSNVSGEYILKINAQRLISTPAPTNMPYRVVVNFPDDTVKVFEGVYNNLYANDPATPANEESPLLPVVKITKTVNGDGSISFTAVQL